MEITEILQALFRWIHVVAGILWIGLLYFFNWVNPPFQGKMDGPTKKAVNPELLPRALYWFRWGAAYTWVTGVLLLLLVFYHGQIVLGDPTASYGIATWVMLAVTFLGVFAYDAIFKTPALAQNLQTTFFVGLALVAAVTLALVYWAGFSYRATVIHVGSLFGTAMAFNVWFRIWPAQQKIITAVKNGQAPDAALVGLAGLRSKHNTFMSVPLVWAMINMHTTTFPGGWISLLVVVAVGWIGVSHLYKLSAKVPGF